MNLSAEGRQLKQAAIAVLKQFSDSKSPMMHPHQSARVMQFPPSAADLMLMGSGYDTVGSEGNSPSPDHDDEVLGVSRPHDFSSLESVHPHEERQV